ncbi:MAG: lysophospholipid acyltransferase family protein [Planctomycetota bacterium]
MTMPWGGIFGISGVLLVVGLFAWFVHLVRSTQYTVKQLFFWLLDRFLTRALWRTRVESTFPIGAEGNAVVICNHRSSIDPFFIQISVRRVIHWMVAKEYCEHPVFGPLLRIAEVIPVNRGGIDTASTKAAIRRVAAGGMVGMLPEGRINTTGKFMRPVRPGAVIVALKARAPIVPCYIENAPYGGAVWSPFFMLAKTRVYYGKPIDLSPYYGREKNEEVVRKLLIEAVSAIAKLAGHDNFVPELAGRRWKVMESEIPSAEETP